MKEVEQELANELDAFLTAQLHGLRLPPVDEDAQAEAQLAADLLNLAAHVEPDPVFLSDVEAQLLRAASHQQNLKRAPERLSPWSSFWQIMKEGLTMKRTTFALGTFVTIVVIGIFAFFWARGGVTPEPEVIAGVPEAAVSTNDTNPTGANAGGETAVQPTDTEPAPANPNTPDNGSLPKLPALGQGGGRGIGGGGGDAAAMPQEGAVPATEDSMMIDRPFIWNPLADAQYTVSVPFPADPTTAAVYQQPGTSQFTLEEVQHYAQILGMNGPIYTEVFPEPQYGIPVDAPVPDVSSDASSSDDTVAVPAPDVPAWTPPTYYYIFDGQRQLSFYDTGIYYFDQGVSQNFNYTTLPFDQAAPIAEAFLQERGLLDFPYEMSSPYNGDVEFHRIIDGRVNTTAEFYVAVTDQNQILSISYQPFNKLSALGDYPLRSAEDAWQEIVTTGVDYMHSYWFTYPGPDYVMPEVEPYVPSPQEEQYRYWQRTFTEGDPITLVSYPLVYLAVNGDAAPRIMVDQYLLSGATADLEALAAYAGQPVHIDGIVHGTAPNISIELTKWEPAENQQWQYMPGTIQFDGEQVLFHADGGETFIVPNPPADLTDGEAVNLSGWSIERGDSNYRVFNWSSMDRIVNWDEQPVAEEPMPVEPAEDPYKITDVTINKIDLVYQYSPVYKEMGGVTSFLLQPAWRFTGTTNTNEIIELYVQAVPNEFVESTGQ